MMLLQGKKFSLFGVGLLLAGLLMLPAAADNQNGSVQTVGYADAIRFTAQATPWLTTGNVAPPGSFLGTLNPQPLIVSTNATERMRIDTVGNVGIGTTAPATRLHSVGTIRAVGGLQVLTLSTPGAPTVTPQGTTGTTTWGYRITARSSVGETLASAEGRTTTGNATLGATNFNRITWGAVAGAVDYRVYRTTARGTPATTGLIGTTVSTTFDDTGLAASGAVPTVDTSGNVGIGTIEPWATLDIQRNSANINTAPMLVLTNVNPQEDIWGNSPEVIARAGIRANAYGMRDWYAGGLSLLTRFWAGAAYEWREGITILYNGNVGIGTTGPQSTLSIGSPNFRLDKSEASPNAGYIRFGDNTGWQFHIGRSQERVGGAYNTGTIGVLMTVLDTGNVGIGTTAPSSKLTIDNGDLRVNNGYFFQYNDIGLTQITRDVLVSNYYTGAAYSEARIRIGNKGSANWDNVDSFLSFSVYDTPSWSLIEIMRLVDGNVGIGTTTPTEQLEITRNFRLPPTTATTGIIMSGDNNFIHNFGTNNFFAGVNAGNLTMTGSSNTGVGVEALFSNITGSWNTAVGLDALTSNTTGNANTAVGRDALLNNTTAGGNTAMGCSALRDNTTGWYNTAVGIMALDSNTTGWYNTAVGYLALGSNTTGSNNTAIGWGADVSTGGLTNATAIGAGAIAFASNTVLIGNTAVEWIGGQVGWTAVSDATQKENFLSLNGQQVLQKLRGIPVYSWNFIGHDPKQFRHYGPNAQDFFAAFGHDGLGTIGSPTTLTSGDVDGILMVSVQTLYELSLEKDKQIEELTKEIEELKQKAAKVDELQQRIEQLEKLVKELMTSLKK